MTHLARLFLMAGLLWTMGSVGTFDAGEPVPKRATPSPPDAKRVVREAYARLEGLIQASGADLALDLEGFRNLDQTDFASALWIELVTMPAAPMIDVHRATHTRKLEGEPGETRVQYIPSWNDTGPTYLETAEGQRLATLTVQEVLRELGPHQPAYAEVEAMTTYSVRVQFDGRERAYRAAVLWGPSEPEGSFGALFVDHITQGISEAVVEEHEPTTGAWRDAEQADRARTIVVND